MMPFLPFVLLDQPVPAEVATLVGGALTGAVVALWRRDVARADKAVEKAEANAKAMIEAMHHSSDAMHAHVDAMRELSNVVHSIKEHLRERGA